MSLNGITNSLSKLFTKRPNKHERVTEIGLPTNVKQHIHVCRNTVTGNLEGLPSSWIQKMNTKITQAEQNGITNSPSRLFTKRPKKHERVTEIGLPTNVKQNIHVSRNTVTGNLEGLPSSWTRLINTQITQTEQNKNPNAAYQAVKFYNYSIKKKEPIPFKALLTEEAITEESIEIDKVLDKKNGHQSQDSDISLGQSSEEEINQLTLKELSTRQTMPALPPKKGTAKPPVHLKT